MTISGPGAGRNLRVVVTVPTLRLAGVAATLGSALTPVECRHCEHAKLERGVRVAGWVSGRFTDSLLVAVSDDELITVKRGHSDGKREAILGHCGA